MTKVNKNWIYLDEILTTNSFSLLSTSKQWMPFGM